MDSDSFFRADKNAMKKLWIHHNHPYLDHLDVSAIRKPFESRWLAEGPISRALEKKIRLYAKQRYAKVTSSGTSALHLALLALQVGQGDEVILSTYVCTALLNALSYVGAKPVLVDIDERNLGPSACQIQKKITRKTKAIIVNHAFGFPADILKIKAFGIPIIEDCAQALGSELNGKPLGSFGELSTFSFYATKMIAGGYGGMVLSRQASHYQTFCDLTHFDQRRDYKVRYNYGFSDLLAAVTLAQFSKLDFFLRRRKLAAAQYHQAVNQSGFYTWQPQPHVVPNYYRFVIGSTLPFKKTIARFKKEGIEVINPIEPYQLLHRYLKVNPKHFPVSEAISQTLVSVPIHPNLTQSQILHIAKTIRNF